MLWTPEIGRGGTFLVLSPGYCSFVKHANHSCDTQASIYQGDGFVNILSGFSRGLILFIFSTSLTSGSQGALEQSVLYDVGVPVCDAEYMCVLIQLGHEAAH